MPEHSEHLPLDLDVSPPDPLEHCTDLPLPLSGNGGNSAPNIDTAARLEELLVRLDETLRIPAAPPLHNMDAREVWAWVDEAAEGLRWRRDRTELIRAVDRIVHDEFRTARAADLLREQIDAQIEREREMAAGTYWQRRDGRRRAQQPTHVEVEPAAWQRAKALATTQGIGIGEYVGRLVASELRAPSRRQVPSPGQTQRLFARLAVEKTAWRTFVADTHRRALTVQRRIGLIVERL